MPLLTIVIPYKQVPSLNTTANRARHWTLARSETSNLRNIGYCYARQAVNGQENWQRVTGLVRLELWIYQPTKIKSDILNKDVKAILDGFTDASVWKDDSQIEQALFVRCHDKENPRVEFRIEVLGNDNTN